jgi:Holliday junction resolvase-like predicted endonuclease
MGYDTYLQIGDRCTFTWRKHANELPRMLFEYDQLHVRMEDVEEGDQSYSVKFSATVGEVLETLAKTGLGWNAAVSAYAAVRVEHGQAYGAYMGDRRFDGMDWERLKGELDEFARRPAELDLLRLGELMKMQSEDEEEPDIVLLESLINEERSPHTLIDAFEAYKAAMKHGVEGKYEILRAVESLILLQRDAPLLAWPLIVCVFLRSLPLDELIELDLSDDAADISMVSSEEDARAYAAQYWQDSSKALAGTAQSLARLFGVLSSFDGALSTEFWAARSADLLSQLLNLNADASAHTTKSRGDALESLVEALVRAEGAELTVIEKNFRTAEEEIDIVLSNSLADPFWVAQRSPLILVECKNWKESVGVSELRVLESKMRDRGALCRIGIFVSLSGFTKPFIEHLRRFQETGGIIFAVDGSDLAKMVEARERLTNWLKMTGLKRALGG